jgi:hypothetical protein
MKAILANHSEYEPDWLKDYPELDYIILDQSETDNWAKDIPKERIVKYPNKGNSDCAKLTWIIENYDTLPEVFIWGKANLFKYITKEEFDTLKDNQDFTPLLTQNHKTYSDKFGKVCYYEDGMYYERGDNWYVNQFAFRIPTLNDFAWYLSLPAPANYVPFAPGGNYILTRERVYRYGRDMYEKMRDTLLHSQLPAEAHFCERLYLTIWK